MWYYLFEIVWVVRKIKQSRKCSCYIARILDFSFLQRELDIANKQLSLVPKIPLSRNHYLRCFYSGRLGKVEILTLGVGFRSFWENENDGEGERVFSLLSPLPL